MRKRQPKSLAPRVLTPESKAAFEAVVNQALVDNNIDPSAKDAPDTAARFVVEGVVPDVRVYVPA